MTALHWAAFHGRTGHVRLLLEKKADLLSRDTAGKLPLHWAAQVLNTSLTFYIWHQYANSPYCSIFISSGAYQENLFDKSKLLKLVIISYILLICTIDFKVTL